MYRVLYTALYVVLYCFGCGFNIAMLDFCEHF